MAQKKKRLITAEDLYNFQLITACAVSPDGKNVIYAVKSVEKETEKKYTHLWIVPASGKKPRQLTFGKNSNHSPKWSPDGKNIAFLSNRLDEKQEQFFLLPMEGGEAVPLTDLKGEFGGFEWSPDGKKLICEFRKTDAEVLEREKDENKKKLGITSRHIHRIFYKLDGYGYLPKERMHLWVIDAKTGAGTQLTDSEIFDEHSACWSPDGKQIVFVSNRSDDPDLYFESDDLFVMDASGKNMRLIETPAGAKQTPRFSPDGKWIAYLGQDGQHNEWKNNNLWITAADGSSQASNLTGKYDINVSGWTINDMGETSGTPPTWSPDGQLLYFSVGKFGSTILKSITTDGGKLTDIVGGSGVVNQFSFSTTGQQLCYLLSTMADPCQIWFKEMGKDTPKQLTEINKALLNSIELGSVEEVWFKGAANNDLQGWILKPPHFDADKKYPAILEIHGGPLVQYGNSFMHEFYYLAAQGYVVFFCNPRGGQGYGEEHAKAIHGAWGTADYADLMKWTDQVAEKPYIDADRIGVTGGSYGGYMTNWIIGHTHRFKAAVTQRSVSNLLSMWGSSDFNWAFQETFDNKAPYESIDVLWECSPMKHIGSAKTPTMVIHSEQDLRCPIEQDEQVYVALRKLGVDTEFVIFPNEPHGLSRGGRTDRRIDRLQSIARWFNKYLQ